MSEMFSLPFVKMEGCGNDFVMVNAIRTGFHADPAAVRLLADRHFGVGCDQVLVAEPPCRPDAHCLYRIFNPDGSEAGICGNGARCLASFLVAEGAARAGEPVRLEIPSGVLTVEGCDGAGWTVDMGVPSFDPAALPFLTGGLPSEPLGDAVRYRLDFEGGHAFVVPVSVGNPHAVIFVDEDLDAVPVEALGPRIECHPAFPERVNVHWVAVKSRRSARMRVWERGAGVTLACGSGATSVAAAGMLAGLLDDQVEIELPGGKLHLARNVAGHLFMTGPARRVFEGSIALPGRAS